MRKASAEWPERLKTREEARVESAVFLGLISALLPWIVVNLAGLLDALNKAGAFASASAVIVTLLFFHALCSFLWAFGLRLSHLQLKLLGKIVLVIDGGMSAISLCYAYLLFVVIGESHNNISAASSGWLG